MTDVDTTPDISSNSTDSPTDDATDDATNSEIEQLRTQNEELTDRIEHLEDERDMYRQRLDRTERENRKLKQNPNFVATVQELLDNSTVLLKQHGNNQEAVTTVTEEQYNSLEPHSRVAIDNSLNVVKELPDETDARAQVMHVTESPDVGYEDVGGVDNVLTELRETVEKPLVQPEAFDDVGIDPPSGVLLHGPPGTGKTLMARAVAAHTDATMIQLSGSDLARKFIGEGAKLVRELFDYAREAQPAIIFIDEFDAIAAERTDSKTSGDAEVQRTLMQLLSEMDGFSDRGDISIVAATNRVDMLDYAVMRPGRFDRVVEVSEPSAEGRREILNIHTREMNVSEDVALDDVAAKMGELTGAEIEAVCREAGMFALRNDREVVTENDFTNAVQKVVEDESNDDVAGKPLAPAFA